MSYATDGLCHNANRGTFNHECGKPATWIGTNRRTGFRSGYCDHCKEYGDEAQYCDPSLWDRIGLDLPIYSATALEAAIAARNQKKGG